MWVLGIGTVITAPLRSPREQRNMEWTAVPDLIVPKPITSPYFRTEFPDLLWRSFVGLFGWMDLAMPEWLYRFFAALAGMICKSHQLMGKPKTMVGQATATGVAIIGNFTLNNWLIYHDRRLTGWGGAGSFHSHLFAV